MLVVLTQKRVIFIDKGLIYGIKSTEIPLDMVNGVSYSKGILLGKVSITNGAITTAIDNVDKNTAPILTDKIKETAEHKESLRTPVKNTPIQVLDGPDQIKKYKSLEDEGIITHEEFEAKKKQIMGI